MIKQHQILKYLNSAYGGTSMLDLEQALKRLKEMRWDQTYTIDSFKVGDSHPFYPLWKNMNDYYD